MDMESFDLFALILLSVIDIASFPIVPVAVISVVAVMAPVVAKVDPSNVKLASPWNAFAPVTVVTVLLVEPV